MRILLATDGSRYARAAARFLARFVPGPGKQADVLAVVPRAPRTERRGHSRAEKVRAQWRAPAKEWVDATAKTLSSRGYAVNTVVRSGEADRVVVERSGNEGYDLVVAGAKGRAETPFFGMGSVALAVLENAPGDVLLVRERKPGRREKQVPGAMRPLRVLIPTDGKPHSDAAVDRFASLISDPNTEVTVVSVRDPVPVEELETSRLVQQLERAARVRAHNAANRLAPLGTKVETRVLEGRPADAVTAEAVSLGADLIVLGSRGVQSDRTATLGSVALEVARSAACSVLVVRNHGS